MYKKTISYTDYDGNERTEDFYFNLTKPELTDLELSVNGGIKKMAEKAVQEKNGPVLLNIFKEIVKRAYGEKSPDGRRFMKSEEITKNFTETEAYVIMFLELVNDEKAATAFIEQTFPKDMVEEAKKANA